MLSTISVLISFAIAFGFDVHPGYADDRWTTTVASTTRAMKLSVRTMSERTLVDGELEILFFVFILYFDGAWPRSRNYFWVQWTPYKYCEMRIKLHAIENNKEKEFGRIDNEMEISFDRTGIELRTLYRHMWIGMFIQPIKLTIFQISLFLFIELNDRYSFLFSFLLFWNCSFYFWFMGLFAQTWFRENWRMKNQKIDIVISPFDLFRLVQWTTIMFHSDQHRSFSFQPPKKMLIHWTRIRTNTFVRFSSTSFVCFFMWWRITNQTLKWLSFSFIMKSHRELSIIYCR